jgi:Putative addiction module component
MRSPRVRAVLELVAELSADERGELREELDGALCVPDEWDRAWNDELTHRIMEIERGEAKLLTEEELFADDALP